MMYNRAMYGAQNVFIAPRNKETVNSTANTGELNVSRTAGTIVSRKLKDTPTTAYPVIASSKTQPLISQTMPQPQIGRKSGLKNSLKLQLNPTSLRPISQGSVGGKRKIASPIRREQEVITSNTAAFEYEDEDKYMAQNDFAYSPEPRKISSQEFKSRPVSVPKTEAAIDDLSDEEDYNRSIVASSSTMQEQLHLIQQRLNDINSKSSAEFKSLSQEQMRLRKKMSVLMSRNRNRSRQASRQGLESRNSTNVVMRDSLKSQDMLNRSIRNFIVSAPGQVHSKALDNFEYKKNNMMRLTKEVDDVHDAYNNLLDTLDKQEKEWHKNDVRQVGELLDNYTEKNYERIGALKMLIQGYEFEIEKICILLEGCPDDSRAMYLKRVTMLEVCFL